MAAFDPNEMITRFRDRATAVRKRPLPPIAGEERQKHEGYAKVTRCHVGLPMRRGAAARAAATAALAGLACKAWS